VFAADWIVPFLYGGVVTEHHWLDERQFVDAVAVAMITPGPVVITVGFIGYLDRRPAGLRGGGRRHIFCPATCSRSFPAPYFKKHASVRPSSLLSMGHGGRDRHDRRICHRAGPPFGR